MKKLKTTIILFVMLLPISLSGQEVGTQLNDAHRAYNSGNLHEARAALRQAIYEIDISIGKEILKLLPESIEQMHFNTAEDNVASAGIAGIIVNRSYANEDRSQHASLDIISDSPMLAGISSLLALPMFGGDPNQKRIRIGSRRALLEKSEDSNGVISWNVHLPMGSTLLTFNWAGTENEKDVTDFMNSLPVDDIVRLTR